jgi:hypothetical protein
MRSLLDGQMAKVELEWVFSEVAPALLTLHTGHVDQLKAGPPLVPPSM